MEERIERARPAQAGPLARLVAGAVGRLTIGEPLRVFTALGRHRRLFRYWLPFAGTMLLRTELGRADVEVVVLRTACNCSSAYEWAQHATLARQAGVSAAAVAAVPGWHGPADGSTGDVADDVADGLSRRQRLLLAATDELHEHRVVSAPTWLQLTAELTENQLIELCMLVGHYEMLAMTLNSLGIEPERSALAGLDAPGMQTADRLRAGPGTTAR